MKTLIQLSCCFLFLTTACDTPKNGNTNETDKTPKLFVSPNKSHPSEIIYLNLINDKLDSSKDLKLMIGEQCAEILDVNEEGQIAALTPMLKTGNQKVVLFRKTKVLGTTQLHVQEPLATQLLLEMNEQGNTRVIRKKASSGLYTTGFADKHFQLSYDIFSKNGSLLYSASIPHPMKERIEVYDSPKEGGMFQSDSPKQVTFPLKIPNIKEAALIKLYESPSRLDLTNADQRKERKQISEIEL